MPADRPVVDGPPEWDEISGDGSAELEDDGTIEVELSFDKATTPSLPVDANDFFNSLLGRNTGERYLRFAAKRQFCRLYSGIRLDRNLEP